MFVGLLTPCYVTVGAEIYLAQVCGEAHLLKMRSPSSTPSGHDAT